MKTKWEGRIFDELHEGWGLVVDADYILELIKREIRIAVGIMLWEWMGEMEDLKDVKTKIFEDRGIDENITYKKSADNIKGGLA